MSRKNGGKTNKDRKWKVNMTQKVKGYQIKQELTKVQNQNHDNVSGKIAFSL